jgi:diguanylate cyclase (GGDEF)-like protein
MDIRKTNKPIDLLLIEDNPGDLLLTKRMLEKAQYTVFHISYANNLSAGIDCARRNKIDVILSDLNLPDSLDVDTFYMLKLQVPEIPIVVLSGFADEEASLKAVQEGAQDYLIKGQINGSVLERSLLYAIERKRVEDTVKRLAYLDPLTGLPNRALFTDRFMMAKANSKRYGMKTALIMLDLDHFKDINDNFGFDAGDQLLKEVGSRLLSALRQTDTVCRMGGDEFALLISEVTLKKAVGVIVHRIHTTIRKPFACHGFGGMISASLGIAIYPEDGESLETLIKHADKAMHEVKKARRDDYSLLN